MWVYRSRDSHINKHTSKIVNWYRNRSAKTTLSYILLFEHGWRLNSTVYNHKNNRKFGRMRRWFRQHLFHMQYEHGGVEITLSILTRIRNKDNGKRNPSAKTTPSFILSLGLGSRLSLTVYNHTNNRKFGRTRRWFCSIYVICNMSMKESR